MTARSLAIIALSMTMGFVVAAHAQALTDPTRPPNAPDGTQDSGPAGTQLQSVLIAQGRRLAIINGQTVALGDSVGEAKVVRITETEVVLQKGSETEVLKLFPGIDKQPVKRGRTRARSGALSEKPPPQGRSQ